MGNERKENNRRDAPRKRQTERPAREKRQPEQPRSSRAAQEAQRRREERKERDSLAAQEAQRRRAERKERARLDAQRDKQKRKAKHRTRKRISAEVWKRLLIMGGIVAAVVLSMIIFFRVRSIEVIGNSYYTPEEIIAAAGVAEGDNLLTVSRGSVAGNVMAQLPYIHTVRVTRKLPDSLVLTVTEFDATYAVRDTAGDRYLITANGKVTEQVDEREASSHIPIEDLTIETPAIGSIVQVHAAEGEELGAQGQLDALTKLLTEIENAELVKQITSVSVPSSFRISVCYGDRFEVNLGNTDRLDYKLEYLKTIVAKEKEYTTGTIDLSLSEGEEAHVMYGD